MKNSLALGAALLCAAAAAAQLQPVADPPPPPQDATADQLRAWKDQYLHAGSFTEVASDANRVLFLDAIHLQKLPDGHVVATFRTELFRPTLAEGLMVRSVRKRLEVDCDQWRYKELVVDGFAASNMQQPVAGLRLSDQWTKPLPESSSAGMSLRIACSKAGSAKPAA